MPWHFPQGWWTSGRIEASFGCFFSSLFSFKHRIISDHFLGVAWGLPWSFFSSSNGEGEGGAGGGPGGGNRKEAALVILAAVFLFISVARAVSAIRAI